jgi:L-amino acid N-acyltransferase YncA
MHLRPAQAQDAAAIAAVYAPYVTGTAVSFETEAPTAEEIAARIAKAQSRWAWLVCEEAGQVLAYAYAGAFAERACYRWSTTVSVYAGPGQQRRGLGRALYTALLGLLAQQGFHSAFAGITLPNAGSVGLHQAMGFVPVGRYEDAGHKLGAWHDVAWFRLGLNDRGPQRETPAPAETRTLAQVLATPAGAAALAAGQALLRA